MGHNNVVPHIVREVDLEGLLGQITYLNLIGLDEEAARKALISGIEQGRNKPPAAPRFPGAARPKEALRAASLKSTASPPRQILRAAGL